MTKNFEVMLGRCWRWRGLLVGALILFTHTSLVATEHSVEKGQTKPPLPATSVSGEEIREAKQRLTELGYWLDLKAEGTDASLRHALIAFQKVEGRTRKGVLTPEELKALRSAVRPTAREAGYAHLEIDLCRQVLLIVEVGEVSLRILPVSTGSGKCFTEGGVTRRAITPQGRFTIRRKIAGWRKSPLGLLYYPNYIRGGVAIHGNPSVPAEPASHGCIRIPMFAAKEFSQLATVGMPVIIYDSSSTPGRLPLKSHPNF